MADITDATETSSTCVLYTNVMNLPKVRKSVEGFILADSERAYTPTIERVKRFHGVDRKVTKYMFPGYLFIDTDDPLDLYQRVIMGMGTVIFRYCRVIHNNEYIAVVHPREQRRIRELCDGDYILKMSEGYIKGDELIVTQGPLKDFKGKLLRIDRHKKTAVIECQLLGGSRPVTVGLEVIRKI